MNRPGRLSAAAIVLLAGTALVPWLAGGARAQDATSLTTEQTTSLAHALGVYDEATVTRLFGPGSDRVTPEGDHYVVKMPLDQGRSETMVSGDDVTYHAKALDGGRWQLDALTLPATFIIGPKGAKDPIKVELNTTGLDYKATIDPANATPSAADVALATMHAHLTGSGAAQPGKPPEPLDITLDSGKLDDHATTSAAIDGRVDQATTFSLADLAAVVAGTKPVNFKVGKLSGDMKIAGLSPERSRAFATKLAEVQREAAKAAPTPAPIAGVTPPVEAAKPTTTPEQRAAYKELIAIGRDLLTSVTLNEEADGVTITGSDGRNIQMAKLSLLTEGSAPGGKLDAKESITMEGLVVPGLPPGPIAGLIPRHVVMVPHVTGIPTDDLAALANQMLDNPNADPSTLAPAGMAMLAKGPIHVGLDQLAFDLGPATFEADGAYDIVSPTPTANNGSADIKATNLDDLMKVLSTDEQTKPGVAAIIFLKGIGKQDGNAVTWHVDYKDSHILVNGTDMSQLIPHGN